MGETRSRRVFFALWPDEAAFGQLSALAHGLAGGPGARPVPPASLHLTLAFVGPVTPAQAIRLEESAAAVRAATFDLSLDRLGFWPRRGILWAGCRQAPAPLCRLADALALGLHAAGFNGHDRPGSELVPHVTLARRVRCAAVPLLGTPIRWRVREFALVESRLSASAASYETLASFRLDEADGVCG